MSQFTQNDLICVISCFESQTFRAEKVCDQALDSDESVCAESIWMQCTVLFILKSLESNQETDLRNFPNIQFEPKSKKLSEFEPHLKKT